MHVSFIGTGHQLLTETFPSVPHCTTSEINNYPLVNRETEIRSSMPRNIKITTMNYRTLLMPAVSQHCCLLRYDTLPLIV